MSYNILLTRNTIPADDNQAWKYLWELKEKENRVKAADFLALIEKFKLKYPCICDLEDPDAGIWSDGPLSNNAGENVTTLGLIYPAVEEALPFLIQTANENGFVVFDDQVGEIFRPI